MRTSVARALIQVIALLTGLVVADVWRARHNVLRNYPELSSAKVDLGRGVMGAYSFTVTPISLAGGALNLAAWFGHQEVRIAKSWPSAPAVSFRVSSFGRGEAEVRLRSKTTSLLLRLSGRAEHPSAWLEADAQDFFTRRVPLPYALPDDRPVSVELRVEEGKYVPVVDGTVLPSHPAPAGPLDVSFRGDSEGGKLRIRSLRISNGADVYERTFSGTFPWAVLLVASAIAAMVLTAAEFFLSLRAATIGAGVGLLVLGALLALYRGVFAERYPLEVKFGNVSSRIETRDHALARLGGLAASPKPVLLWLGGSQAWGAGALRGESTEFALLRARLGPASGLEWVNGAISAAHLRDQHEVLNLVARRRKVALVVLTTGVNDGGNRRFPDELRDFAAAVKATGAKLLLIAEPSESGTSANVPPANRAATRRSVVDFAREAGLPFLDLQTAFDRRGDDGFLWWDFVHFTDAGARVAADAVAGPLAAALAEASRR